MINSFDMANKTVFYILETLESYNSGNAWSDDLKRLKWKIESGIYRMMLYLQNEL